MIAATKIMMTRQNLAKSFQMAPHTVDNRLKEIEEQIKLKRYGPHSIVRDVGYVACNPLVFADYLTYRQQLRSESPSIRKSVPPYNAFNTCKEFELQTSVDFDAAI